MKIAFLHTGDMHVPTFSALLKELNFDGEASHTVAADLLERAQTGGVEAIRADTVARLMELSSADAVLCTCSTIGPSLESLPEGTDHILRIDAPAMQEAIQIGPRPTIAIALESTREPTLALLHKVAGEMGVAITPRVVFCEGAWAYTEQGDFEGFANRIAECVRNAVADDPETDSVLLAQASMRVAAAKLEDLSIPVLATPMPAVKALLAKAASRCSEE